MHHASNPVQQQQSSFQDYNGNLMACLQELRTKRDNLVREMNQAEREKVAIQQELAVLTDKLHKINESLQQKMKSKADYDKTITETESAYLKIMESSSTLLHVLKRETQNLGKRYH